MFRSPNEVGGAYWLFSFMLSLASLPIAATYYERNVGENAVTDIAWCACYMFVPALLALKVIFFTLIKKEYLGTFWSLKRGCDVAPSYMESSDDSVRATIFRKNRRHWIKVEGKVEEWVRGNWERWMEEEPEWLNENVKARIPPHMIPNIKDREKVKELQIRYRRSTVLGRISARKKGFVGAKKVTPE